MKNNLNQNTALSPDSESKGILTGNRIPKDYFITKGIGQSDIAIHAGSYHLALKDADIEMCNIMTYSSILPKIATKIERPAHIEHGCVMESIMSVCNAKRGQIASAGIIYGWLYNRKTGEKYGGLVCEHYGNYKLEKLKELLHASLNELYTNGFSDDYEIKNLEINTQSLVVEKEYGTALVALCFTSYFYPIIRG